MWFDIIKVDYPIGDSEEEFLEHFNRWTATPEEREEERERLKEEQYKEIKEKQKAEQKRIEAAKQKAEQLVIETANKLDYVTINGNWIEIEPEWGKNIGFTFGEASKKYVFNINNIHDGLCIIKVITDSTGTIHEEEICLSENKDFNAPIADSYVTVMLMANNKNSWISMWDDA